MIFLFASRSLLRHATFSAADLKAFYDSGLKKNGIVGSSLFLIRDKEVVAKDFYGDARRDPVASGGREHRLPLGIHHEDLHRHRHHAAPRSRPPEAGRSHRQIRAELRELHDPLGPVDDITIRHAMTHSTGLRSATWPWGGDKPWHPFEPTKWSQIVAMLPYTEVEFKPGSRFSYSNLAVVFLGQIIERLSGDDYEVYIDKNILKPLQMYQSYFDRSPYHLLKYRSASFNLSDGIAD